MLLLLMQNNIKRLILKERGCCKKMNFEKNDPESQARSKSMLEDLRNKKEKPKQPEQVELDEQRIPNAPEKQLEEQEEQIEFLDTENKIKPEVEAHSIAVAEEREQEIKTFIGLDLLNLYNRSKELKDKKAQTRYARQIVDKIKRGSDEDLKKEALAYLSDSKIEKAYNYNFAKVDKVDKEENQKHWQEQISKAKKPKKTWQEKFVKAKQQQEKQEKPKKKSFWSKIGSWFKNENKPKLGTASANA